jgi:hypothetical protein
MKRCILATGFIVLMICIMGVPVLAADTIVWEYNGFQATSIDVAPNGNYLFMNGPAVKPQIIEVAPDKTIVNTMTAYFADDSAHFLDDGSILIAGKYSGVFKKDFQGNLGWGVTFFVDQGIVRYVTSCNHAYQLPNGHILAAGFPTFEYDPSDEWLIGPYGHTYPHVTWISPTGGERAERLNNGNTLLVTYGQIFEEAPDGTIVWTYAGSDSVTDAHRLPNGNTLFCDATSVKEISSDGTVVWEYMVVSPTALPLNNGNILISDPSNSRIIEVARGSVPVTGLTFTAKCPVDIAVTDPEGHTISKTINEIAGASYSETAPGSDGRPDVLVSLPEKKPGKYFITATPRAGVLPTETFTLEVTSGDTTKIITANTRIQDISTIPFEITITSDGKIIVTGTGTLPVPEFPFVFLPVTLVVALSGAVFFIRGTGKI